MACICQLKKNAQRESCKVSFIWEQNEDCSPGDSTSDSLNCSKEVVGKESLYVIFVKVVYMWSSMYFL